MTTLQAYKNDPKLKADFLKEVEKHRKDDAIVQGTYGRENGKWRGCAVACSLRSLAILDGEPLKESYSNHKEYETKLGIPEWLAHLEDAIFEGLPVDEAKKWPGAFAKAISVGANLEPVKWKFCAHLMKENIERVLSLDISEDLKKQVVDAIRAVLAVHEKAIETSEWDASAAEWAAESARSAARSATRSAAVRSAAEWAAESARSAAWAAESAEWAAARSAAWAAESAAWAEWAAARSATRSAAYLKHSKELLRLLKAA